jgi:hypothetical protein
LLLEGGPKLGRLKKNPAVELEKADQWLRRVEEKGDSAPQIAKIDNYDVRTVRKALEKARDRRERNMARGQVLRNALEQHYADLVSYVDQLEEGLNRDTRSFHLESNVRLRNALHQHLPKWAIWKLAPKLERLNSEIFQISDGVRKKIRSELLPQVLEDVKGFDLDDDGIASALFDLASDIEGHIWPELRTGNVDQGRTEVSYGRQVLGKVPLDQIDKLSKRWASVLGKVIWFEEAQEMRRLLEERHHTTATLVEEFETIKLRRVVPGKCKYCPI